jgi:exopolysaccharide biosynthesis polyprenyl glycosylphosphotransferase
LRAQYFQDGSGPATLRKIARQHCIDEVIIAIRDMDLANDVLSAARHNQLDVTLVPAIANQQTFELESIGNLSLLKVHQQAAPEWQLAGKRLVDVILALLGLICVSPFLLVIAMLIRYDSRGPALFRSQRVGHKGRNFLCYKFRTMVLHSDAAKDWLRHLNERRGAFFKIANDPRITRVGSFLRRYSLDELPQLWNVLRGDMSLVGPRPHPPDDVEAYSTDDLQRLDFVPGMTGLWQVTARQDPSFRRCVELDVEYIKRWTPWLDLCILCKTIACVFQGSGV